MCSRDLGGQQRDAGRGCVGHCGGLASVQPCRTHHPQDTPSKSDPPRDRGTTAIEHMDVTAWPHDGDRGCRASLLPHHRSGRWAVNRRWGGGCHRARTSWKIQCTIRIEGGRKDSLSASDCYPARVLWSAGINAEARLGGCEARS